MVKKILLFLLFPVTLFAQENESSGRFVHKGLFCFRGSISYGKLFKLDANNTFLVGNLEYFPDDHISLRSDVYFFTGHFNGNAPFNFDHSLFSGALYHFKTNNHFDPYLGMEVGINYAQATNPAFGQPIPSFAPVTPPSKTFTPLFSPIIGFNYFGNNWFHIAVCARYIGGNFADNYNAVSLSEFRFTFGLGFNFN